MFSFCSIWNVRGGNIASYSIMYKVTTLLKHMYINTRLYTFRKLRAYCYISLQPNDRFRWMNILFVSFEMYPDRSLVIYVFMCKVITLCL